MYVYRKNIAKKKLALLTTVSWIWTLFFISLLQQKGLWESCLCSVFAMKFLRSFQIELQESGYKFFNLRIEFINAEGTLKIESPQQLILFS